MLRAQGAREKKWQLLSMTTQHQGCDVLEQRRRAFHRKGTQGVNAHEKSQGVNAPGGLEIEYGV